MLRKVRVDSVGDTPLLPGSVIDKFEFRRDQPGADERREDQGPRRHRVPRRRHRPPRPSSTRRTSASRPPASARPSGSGPSRRRPAPSSWGSPRRPCSPRASSRPPASRRRPRSSPRRPWPARSTTWSASRRTSSWATWCRPGTGFKAHLDAEVRIRPEALEALADKGPAYARYRDEAPVGAGKE